MQEDCMSQEEMLISEAVKNFEEKLKIQPKIAIVGFTGAGKSMLFNAIFGENLAVVNAKSGWTQKGQSEMKWGATFTDTPGFGTDGLTDKNILIEHVLDSHVVIQVLNGSVGATDYDKSLFQVLAGKRPTVVALNKIDILEAHELREVTEGILEKLGPLNERLVQISAKKRLHIETLIDLVAKVMPSEMSDILIGEIDPSFKALKKSRAGQIIQRNASAAATLAVIPIPFSDIFPLLLIQTEMILEIAHIFGIKIGMERAREVLFAITGGIALRTLFQIAVKFAPGIGSLIGPAIAYSGTLAIGKTARHYFEHEMQVKPEELQEYYQRQKETAAQEAEKYDFSSTTSSDGK
jgi:small GTP-binding protein